VRPPSFRVETTRRIQEWVFAKEERQLNPMLVGERRRGIERPDAFRILADVDDRKLDEVLRSLDRT